MKWSETLLFCLLGDGLLPAASDHWSTSLFSVFLTSNCHLDFYYCFYEYHHERILDYPPPFFIATEEQCKPFKILIFYSYFYIILIYYIKNNTKVYFSLTSRSKAFFTGRTEQTNKGPWIP